jgi:AhpD family alkylhydroperoxidase
MEPRLDYGKASPAAMRTMMGLEGFVRQSGIEHSLLHLVKLRASQINGCAYCIDMHSKDARAVGETEQRLYALDAWRETPFYTPRERAALAWTEALTLVREGHVPDAVWEEVHPHFTKEELVNLTMAVVAINGWNRIAIGFRTVPGSYQPPAPKHAEPVSAQPAEAAGEPVGAD